MQKKKNKTVYLKDKPKLCIRIKITLVVITGEHLVAIIIVTLIVTISCY